MTEFKPPVGFLDSPPPAVAGPDKLVSHTEQITIDRPLAQVLASLDATPLAETISAAGGLPGVAATYTLTPGPYGDTGTRHMVFLTDNTTIVEQVLERTRMASEYRWRYVVWNYTTAAAKPLRYGLSEFHYTAQGEATHVRWTYSFELRKDRFPGVLGVGLGGLLLKAAFLNGPYAKWMSANLAGIKARAEAS